MDRRRKLATAGAISLTATAAVVALASSVGLFGLTDDSPRVGKLSPIDSTQSTRPDSVQTIIVDDTVPATSNTSPTRATTPNTVPSGRGGDDDAVSTSPTTTNTLPDSDDEGDDHGGDDDNSGPGSSHSDDDNSGPGSSSSGRDHDEDD